MNDETLVYFGSEVKALGEGKVGGYLVLFGSADEADLTDLKDYFTGETDFDLEDGETKTTLYYQHGFDEVLKKRKLGKGTIGKDAVGVWINAQLELRDEYEKAIYQMAESGKLGWSSGAPGHLVERVPEQKAHRITKWPLGKDASLTPTPADWRNVAVPIKSLIPAQPEAVPDVSNETADAAKGAVIVISNQENTDMTDNVTPPADKYDALEAQVKSTSDKLDQVLKLMQDAPATKNAGYYTVDGGTADRSIKNVADMLLAIQRGDTKRCVQHYGLVPNVKALTEDSGPTGGYYVPQQQINDLLPGVSLVSPLGRLIRRIPVQSPSGTAPIRDYSRTPTANTGRSATALGMESQGRAEAGAYGEENIYAEQLKWRVWDYASGYIKVSKELRNDAPMIEALIREAIQEDVANKEEYSILRGNGVGQPLGVLNWAGVIEIEEDTDNTFAIADSDEMISRLLISGSPNIAWCHHAYISASIAAFTRGTAAAYQTNIAGALPTLLHGYNRFMSQHLPAQGTTGYVVLGDWSKYVMFELGGLYIDFSEHADFLNGNVVWRFGKRQDGQPVLTSAVTLADGSSSLSPFVVLKNKT